DLLCFAEAYRRLEPLLQLTLPVLARVRVLAEDEAEPKLQLMDLQDLASAPLTPPQGLRVRLALDALAPDSLDRLGALLAERTGSARLHLHAYSQSLQFEQILEVETGIAPGAALRRGLEEICGRGSVRVVE
ncbi:MAG: hypothetical protein ACRD2D_02045, partial [Terriglobales bacterium]